MINIVKTALLFGGAAFVLSACGGSSSPMPDSSNAVQPPQPLPPAATAEPINVTGVVVAGFAQCDVDLERLNGEIVASDVDGSNVNGQYELAVEDEIGAFIISATNCTYEDEFSGDIVNNASFRAGIVLTDDDAVSYTHLTLPTKA